MSQHKLHVRKGDTVVVLSGKDKGKRGKVLVALPRQGKVVVEDVGVVTKHRKLSPTMQQGGLQQQEAPIYAAKVMLVCPACKQPARVGQKVLDNGTKVRVCKKCNENIDK